MYPTSNSTIRWVLRVLEGILARINPICTTGVGEKHLLNGADL
jgi:hypothetical protein